MLAFAFLVTLFVGPVQMGTQILTDAQNARQGQLDVQAGQTVLTLGTGMGAIFAVAGDIENRAELVLQLQGLLH